MAYRARILSPGALLFVFALALFASAGHAQVDGELGKRASKGAEPFGVEPVRIVTKADKVADLTADSLLASTRSGECHRQNVTMQYEDSPNKPFIKFIGAKKWCYDGSKVTFGTMEVETWIRPDSQYGPKQDGYRYVPSKLRETDRFLSFNGHRNGAHESIRIGRFEYRVHGYSGAAQVLNPYVSRTGRYTGACDGPKPRDASPKVTAVKPVGGANGVSSTANVEATFSRDMKASSINGYTFYLARKSTGDLVESTYLYDAGKKRAVLNPRGRLRSGVYTATVFAGPFGAMTAEGDPLVANKVWSFTVSR